MEKVSSISRKSLGDWLKKTPEILQCSALKSSRLPGGGRRAPFPDLENHLLQYVKKRRDQKFCVNKFDIRQEALKFSKDKPDYQDFKCSLSYIRNFCVRHYLTYREATHQSQQKLRDPLYDLNVVRNFIIKLKKIIRFYPKDAIFNMDETTPYFEMVSTKTLDFVGSKTVDLLNSGHDKNRFLLIETVSASGSLLPLGVIFKGLKKKPNCPIPSNVFVYVNESGTMDSEIMEVLFIEFK